MFVDVWVGQGQLEISVSISHAPWERFSRCRIVYSRGLLICFKRWLFSRGLGGFPLYFKTGPRLTLKILRCYSHRFLSFHRHETNLYPSVESIGYPWRHWKEISFVIRFFDLVLAVTLYKALEVFGSKLSGHELKIPWSKLYFKPDAKLFSLTVAHDGRILGV